MFFMDMVGNSIHGTKSSYKRLVQENCSVDRASPRRLDEIRVYSRKLDLDIKQVWIVNFFFFYVSKLILYMCFIFIYM